jgi:peroxiredoxin
MKKLLPLIFLGSASLAGSLFAGSGATVGQPAPAFTLVDSTGLARSLSDFAGKIVVLEWTNDGCPYVRKHYRSKNMQTLQKSYTDKGVIWLSIASSAKGEQGNHTAAEWESIRQAQGHHSTALLLDPTSTVARLYGAKCTPHMFVIDAGGTVVYNGAIDSIASTDVDDLTKAHNYVAAALDALLTGKPVEKSTSTPYGCGVKYDS